MGVGAARELSALQCLGRPAVQRREHHRLTDWRVESAAKRLKGQLLTHKLPVEIIGPAQSFYGRRSQYYFWQIVTKSKNRNNLLELAKAVPSDWSVDLDPQDLL